MNMFNKSAARTPKAIADEIASANDEAVKRMNEGRAMLVDFDLAKNVVPGMDDDLVLHAGPPISYKDMIESHEGRHPRGPHLRG